MQNISIAFDQDWSLGFVLIVTAAVLMAVIFFYRRVGRTVGRRYLWLLTGLRTVAMLSMLVCLFRPAIAFQRTKVARSKLFVLVDASKSMSIHDFPSQPDRFGNATEALLQPDGVADKLEKLFDVGYYVFSSHARSVKKRTDLQAQKPDGLATDVATSVSGALGKADPSTVAGVLLFSDGVDNSVGDPAASLANLGVPVFPVGVGSKLSQQPNYRDIAIERVEHTRTVPLDTTAEINCFVRSSGYPDRVVPLALLEGEAEAAREELVLSGAGAEQKVVLRYKAKVKGEHELTASIPVNPDERVRENNTSTFHIYVTEPTIRVLYVEGRVRPEFGAVRRALEFDPNIEVLSLVRTVGTRFLQLGNVKGLQLDGFPRTLDEMKSFRVVILGNLESQYLTPEQMKNLAKVVSEEGVGFMVIGGKGSYGPGGYAGTPIEDILPTYCGGRDAGQEEEPFPLTLTPSGMTHPIFVGCQKFFQAEGREPGVPDLLGCSRVPGPKPGAAVLAINPKRRNENGPLIAVAVGRCGSGRTIASTIDTTYIWDMPLRGMGRDSPFVKFWGQAARWLAGKEEIGKGAKGLSVYPDRHFYQTGEKPRLFAYATDSQGQATNTAIVTAEITRPGGPQKSSHQLHYVDGSRGQYEAELSPLEPGPYEARVFATLDKAPLGEESFGFRVGEPNKEFEQLDLNDPLLKEIARRTRGAYHTILSVEQLVNTLEENVQKSLVPWEFPRWTDDRAILLVLFLAVVLLVTSEWILRRHRHLS